MIDAYTIGITLALENGVSAGLAAICQDLVTLDRAAESAALHLEGIRRAAAGATQALRIAAPPIVAPGAGPEPPPNDPVAPQLMAVPTPPAPLKPRPAAEKQAPPPLGAPPSIPPLAPPAAPAATMVAEAPQEPVTAAPRPPAHAGGAMEAIAFPAVPATAGKPTHAAPPPPDFTSLGAPLALPIPPRPTSDAAPALPGFRAPSSSPRQLPVPAAPMTAPPAPVAPGAAPQAASAPTQPAGASAAADAEQSLHIEGDVFLDGQRVGSWIGDLLARDADRPSAAANFVDPRLSPSWAGIGMVP